MANVSEQFINCIYTHLLIEKTREGVPIVSIECNKLHLLIKQKKKGVAIVFITVYKLYMHSLVNSKDKEGCGYCFSTMHQTPLIN